MDIVITQKHMSIARLAHSD